jgi:4-hydroxy-tetrahydrodipicolinate synthase
MSAPEFRGAFTALVTPFDDSADHIDWAAYEKLVASQLDAGISGLVPCGTTGETPTLSDAEQVEVIQKTVALAKGKVPVLAGTGTFSTKKTIQSSRAALEAGADAVMIVMPYYNKPSQAGMIRHVELVAKEISAPIVLYNIPGRCVVELTVDSTLRILDSCKNVVAVKDASGNVMWLQDLLRRAGNRVTVLSGDDPLTVPMMSVGAQGVISVTSNVVPRPVAEVCADALAGRWAEARQKHLKLYPLHKALFAEPNPQAVKAALAHQGRMKPSVRPPMVEAEKSTKELVARVLTEYERS